MNDVFRRNYDVFGPAGKQRFDPRARYEEGGDLPEAQVGALLKKGVKTALKVVKPSAKVVKPIITKPATSLTSFEAREKALKDIAEKASLEKQRLNIERYNKAQKQKSLKNYKQDTPNPFLSGERKFAKETPVEKKTIEELPYTKPEVSQTEMSVYTRPSFYESMGVEDPYKNRLSNSILKDAEGNIQFLSNDDWTNAIRSGKGNVIKYLENPTYAKVVEHNQKVANRLGLNQVLPIQKEKGLGLYESRLAKIKEPLALNDPRALEKDILFNKSNIGAQYARGLEGKGSLTIPRVFSTDKTIRDTEHEVMHHIYPNLGEGFPSFTPLESLKAKSVFKSPSELRVIEEANNVPLWYLDEVDELVPNTFDLANDLGIQKFQKYPGKENFKNMLEGYTGDKSFIKEALKLNTPRDYKRAWDMMTGVRLGILPATIGAAALQEQKTGGWLDKAQLGKIITRPLTLLTKTEMLSKKGKNMGYRKIGNVAGLQDLIRKKGAQAPAPMKMRSGLYADTPFFGMGKKPNENYRGIYAVEVDPHNPKYNWTSRVAGTDNLGVAPINPKTGELIKNIPLEDLNVYRKKWFSDNYKRLDPENLEEGLKNAKLQSGLENAWKWGVRGTAAVAAHDYMSKDSDDWAPQIQNYINIKQKGGNNLSESTFVRKPIVNIKQPNRQPTADDLAWYSMIAAQERQPDVLQEKQAQGKGSKAWDIMMNPFTAAGHMYQHGSIPDNFTQGPTSALDIAPSFVNPLFAAEMIYNTGKAAVNPQTYKDIAKTAQGLGMKAMGKEGPEGWQEAGLNTLGMGIDAAFALPGVKMAKGLKKNIGKSINKSINKTAKGIKKGVSENMRNYPRPAITPTNFKTGGWLDKYNNF